MSILNTPITINKMHLKDCLMMPPMATAKSEEDGAVTEQLCNYYAEKSAGGYIGLINMAISAGRERLARDNYHYQKATPNMLLQKG